MTHGFWRYSSMVLLGLTVFPASAQLLDLTNINVAVSSSNTTAATIAAGDANGQIAIVADPILAGGDLFEVITSDPSAVVSLLLPGGATEVTSANATTLGFTYTTYTNAANVDSLLAGTFNLAGTHTMILLPPSQVSGTYTVKVNAATAQSAVLTIASFITNSPVRVGATTNGGAYKVGDTMIINGLAFNGSAPITDATMTARVVDTSNLTGNPSDIPLLDSGQYDSAAGDGLYTGTYTATTPGKFIAAVRATGTAAPGGNYVRTASASFTVVQPMASFTSFADAGVDDNANGKPDRLVVSAVINVLVAGTYRVGIALQASNGNALKTSASAALTPGSPTVPLSFRAADIIGGLAVNGPYTLRDATLVSVDGVNNPMVDYVDNAGNTAAYTLSSLDSGSPLYFTGQNTVAGVDTNADGKFDLLRVQAGIVAPVAGTYTWSAQLVNAKGAQITFYNSSQSLNAGSNTINFDFSGATIGQTCSSGVFSVRGVLLFGPGASVITDHLLDTPGFTAAQFTGTACFLVSVAPNSGPVMAGAAQPFTFTYIDAGGSSDLAEVSMLVNSSTAPGAACYVAWNRSDHYIRLYDDAGDGGYTYAADTFNSFSNSQCTITYNNPIVESGNSLTMTISVAFAKPFAGTRNVYMQAQNASGTDTGMQLFGVLGVILTSPCDVDADGSTTVADAQSIVNEALGASSASHDLNRDGFVNVADIQRVIGVLLGNACIAP